MQNTLGEEFWEEIKKTESLNKGNKTEDNFLKSYIKYCLGYLRIQSASLRPLDLLHLDKSYFDLSEFLNINPEDFTAGLYIDLPILQRFSPKNLPEKYKEKYEQEKDIAQKIEELISRYKNEEFTKEIILRFGKFTFTIPPELLEKVRSRKGKRKNDEKGMLSDETEYTDYLFYARVNLESLKGRYLVSLKDDKIFYDISLFEPFFQNENTYYDVLKIFSDSEENLRFPVKASLIEELSNLLISKSKLTKILFSQKKIDLNENAFSISHKINHFLTKDLEELSSGDTTNISTTSLGCMSSESDEDLNITDEETIKSGNILFPFEYNISQINVLKHIKNKALVVEGPPGTGKSQTISNLLCHLASQNKKVLFVSQKQQALRVVKDKLATLKTDHLFGYLTNDITEKDSYDTFSSSLERLKSDHNYLGNATVSPNDIGQKIAEINEKTILFDEGIKQQEEIYKLSEKIKTYPGTYFAIEKFYALINKFTIEKMQEYVDLKKTIANYLEKIANYIKEDNDYLIYNKKFSTVPSEAWERNLSVEIEEMINEMKKFDYENKFLFKKLFLKTQLLLAHQDNIEKLPREISEILRKTEKADYTLGKKIKIFESIKKYCLYQEDLINLELNRENFNRMLIDYGLSEEIAEKLTNLVLNSDKPEKELSNFAEYNSMIEKLKEISPVSYSSIAEDINEIELRRQKLATQYLKNSIAYRSSAYNTIKASIRGKIVSFAKGLKRSKRAFKTFERLRQDYEMFNAVSSMVPIWIMSLDDASRVLPLENNLFDYVILDEASQCNIAYALPSMYRAEKVIIVGDPKQMRDDTVLFKKKSVLEDLANRFKIDEDRRIIGRFENLKSILDIALLRGIKSQFLERHYRSPLELIGFCNKNFYDNRLEIVNNTYLTYQNTNRVLVNHVLKYENNKEDITPSTNYTEAKAIVKLLKEFKNNPVYKEQSIAVLTFFNDQANLIRSEVQREFGLEHDIKISIIEGIQGDERDIVIYSFVIHDPSQKMQYVALTGERGEIRPEITAGRVNVAFSRARKQVHCFTCLPINEWPEGIWINKYLQYIEDNGFVESQKEKLRPFQSHFEEEFYNSVSSKFKNYVIRNQVPSCGYFIDFVLQNPKNNRIIAVECDGPIHDDQIESDIKRQLLLEQAGWRFLRIRYSDWIQENTNKDSILKVIYSLLEESVN